MMNRQKPLTEQRVREVLKALPMLFREAKRLKRTERDHFLVVSRLPNVTVQETIINVVGPQLERAFGESVPEAASLIRDYYRVMGIHGYIQRGGIAAERARLEMMCTEAHWESMIAKMPHPEMIRDKISTMRANAEMALKRLKLILADEETAVAACKAEIDRMIVGQIKRKGKRQKQRMP